jgi:type III restriction enzyme
VNVAGETFPIVDAIAERISEDLEELARGLPCRLLEDVTPVTSELLRWWFQEDYRATRDVNFHIGQRDAIAAIVYAHEVLGAESLLDLYEKLDRSAILQPGRLGELTSERNGHPKYAAKMATGTGKTWVLNALLVWQYLNAVATPDDPRFTTNFLIVAPGLIVYERLLDSFLGRRDDDGDRDFATSDVAAMSELFVPDQYRPSVLAFVQSSTVEKQEIGRKVTGSGLIAITNWHRLTGQEDPDFLDEPEDEAIAPGADIDARAAAASFVPLTPGTSSGNSLDVLDRRNLRGEAMQWLRDLPSLVVFNDEAHHVHSGRAGDDTEVEWQRSLNDLARDKGRRFVQVDFSATPYNESGKKRSWFPHIVTDFSLQDAMAAGLIKALALDKRQEIASIPNRDLEFRAIRGEDGELTLAEGQRTMLRAGLRRLEILEEQFAGIDPGKHPKLLVMVEDTKVSPLVEEFLREEGLREEEFLRIDSKTRNKEELGAKDLDEVRERLFAIDRHADPRVVISVLMLREGFDVNNICVIVPLRSAESGILAEQTVGRGLRLMWRNEPAVDELKAETRERIRRRQAPTNFFDVLFVVEHPRFDRLYEELLGDGLLGEVGDETTRATGDSERVELRPDFEEYDFAVPFIVRDADEELRSPRIDVDALRRSTIPLEDLIGITPRGDRFMAEDYTTRTRFGAFTIDGAKLSARGYNEYLSKLVNRIGGSLSRTFTNSGNLRENPGAESAAMLQVQRPQLLGWTDRYIRRRFFTEDFDPLVNEQWRVLMIDDIADQIAGNLARALVESLSNEITGEPEVTYRRASEVESIMVRGGFSVEVAKSIYPRLSVPSHSGGLERLFMEWADADSAVEALVKIHEYRHAFLRRPYIKADGMPAQYSPDFLVRTADAVYVVETKAQSFVTESNVQRKANAARDWCAQLNRLPVSLRSDREWRYVLLGEKTVREWHDKGMTASELLAFARLRPRTDADDKLF